MELPYGGAGKYSFNRQLKNILLGANSQDVTKKISTEVLKLNYDNLLRLDLPMIRRKVSTKICNMVFIDMVPKACVIFPMRSFMVSV